MKIRYYVIFSILCLVGIVLLWVRAASIPSISLWYTMVGDLASALLICGAISLLQEIFTNDESFRKMMNLFKISEAVKDSGLTDIKTDSNDYNFKTLIRESENFYTIMNDVLRWVETNSPVLVERFGHKGYTTEFYFVNPDGAFAPALAIKTACELQSLKDKIHQSVLTIKETYERSEKKGIVKIYYLKNYPTQSIFYTDHTVVVTTYQTSCGRNVVPLYEYRYSKRETNIAKYLYNDLDNVRNESDLIFDSSRID